MKVDKRALLVAAVVIIIGAIYFLENQKTAPQLTDVEVEEIRIEDTLDASELNNEVVAGEAEEPTAMEEKSEEDAMKDKINGEVMVKDEPKQSPPQTMQKTRAERIAEKAEKYERIKEITTPDGFINNRGEPFTLAEFVGKKVILIDFWTYSCINCQRTFPFLNSWWKKYEDDDLVIVGIHTPEFEFEKDYDNVLDATERFDIEFPVVLDNDFSTWGAYRNRYWPRKYLVDIDGFIVYDHIGEGAYDETERKIVELLNEKNDVLGMNTEVSLESLLPENIDTVDFRRVETRESYFGSRRVEYLENFLGQSCFGEECEYTKPETVPNNKFALEGTWVMGTEESTIVSENGSIFSNFGANKVNLVAGSDSPVQAEIYLDGELISDEMAGRDVVNGVVTFGPEKLYNLVDLQGDYSRHLLEIRFLDGGVSAFAFTFG